MIKLKKIKKNIFLVLLLCSIFILPTFSVAGMKIRAYDVYLNDEYIATVSSEEEAEAAFRNAKIMTYNSTGEFYSDEIEFTIIENDISFESIVSQDELTACIYEKLDKYITENKKTAYILKIGDYKAVLATKEEIMEVLDGVKEQYDIDDEFKISLIKEDGEEAVFFVELEKRNTDNPETVEVMAFSESQDEKTTVKNEITDIFFNENIEICETYVFNEYISSAEEVISDIINNNENPALSVTVTEKSVYVEDFYAEAQYIEDDTMYEGESEIFKEASPGRHEVTVLITKENGEQVSTEIISETVITEPVAAVVKKGTKSLPDYILPVSGAVKTSDFGERWGRMHNGVDLGVVTGTEVRASRAGTVTKAGWGGAYGYCVFIDHGDGVETRYAHLSELNVSEGDYVSQGDVIALSGNTGRSTGPHLHFEIRINDEPINPEDYLSEI